MNKQEIENYNRLCAEFLGWEKCDTVYRTVEYYNNEKVVGNATHPAHMKFHSDWNRIMEVVEKMLDICLNLDSMEMYYNITDAIPEQYKVVQAINQFLIRNEQNFDEETVG